MLQILLDWKKKWYKNVSSLEQLDIIREWPG